MHAATVRDNEIVIDEHRDPEPGPGEVLVRVRAAGINGADILQRKGGYPAPPGAPPDIPGLELAGEVVGLGSRAQRFAEGDRVMAIVGGGGQAELAVVHERQLMPVPDALDWPAAGGFAEVFTTAEDALFAQANLRPGERLLVHGAAGGVGTAGVQLGRTTGAQVVATVRNQAARAAVAALGAEVVAPDGFADRGPFDVVLELVGAPNLPHNLKALNTGGRISASTLRARPLEEKALAMRRVERHVLPLVERGELTVPVAETFSLDEAARAYGRFEAGGKVGKVVVTFD